MSLGVCHNSNRLGRLGFRGRIDLREPKMNNNKTEVRKITREQEDLIMEEDGERKKE